VLDWGAFVTREPEDTDRVDVRIRKGLLLVQIVEAVIKALESTQLRSWISTGGRAAAMR
jgi:hypothetical protein